VERDRADWHQIPVDPLETAPVSRGSLTTRSQAVRSHDGDHGCRRSAHPAEGADWRADTPPRGDRGLDD